MLPGMNRYLPAAIMLAATCLVAACTSGTTTQTPAIASTAACEQAMLAQVKQVEANPGGPTMTRPAACAGLDDATLNKLAEQAMASMWADQATATALPTDLPS